MTYSPLTCFPVAVCATDEESLCDSHGNCVLASPGTFACDCDAGYTGAECDTDINECDPDPCQNGATCDNRLAEYFCECADEYHGTNCESK